MLFYFGAIIAGFATVLQAGMNHQFGDTLGLSLAVLVNCFVFLVGGFVFYFLANTYPQTFPDFVQAKSTLATAVKTVSWWHLFVPGLCGLSIVIGIPVTMHKIGALAAILILICTQVFGGMLWDYFIEGISVSPMRVVGSALVLAGVFIANWQFK